MSMNRNVRLTAVGAIVILVVVGVVYRMRWIFPVGQSQPAQTLPVATVTIGSFIVHAEVAKSAEEQSRGFSYRENLADGQGMLFLFPRPVRPGFWMKEMRFPIDIIWIRDDRIVGIITNLPIPQVGQNLAAYYPDGLVTAALEVPAGWSVRNGISNGDAIHIAVP